MPRRKDGQELTVPHVALGASTASSAAVLAPKFHVPTQRRGTVTRTRLIDRLLDADEPVISVLGPPGFGKTTLLTQWAQRFGTRVAWVSCEVTDNDPVALWTSVVTAVNAVEPVDPAAAQWLATSGGGIGAVPGFVAALASVKGPLALVLDHVELITSRESRASLAEFALRVPPGWRLALASRDPLPVPTARLRAHGQIVEIGPEQLVMEAGEASALLRGAGVELSSARTGELVQRTEGWPVGLYLAALATKAGAPTTGFNFTGDDRLMGDYLRSELLPRLTRPQTGFLIRTSVLDRMSGPLCDAVLGVARSALVLEELVDRNLLVVPLDRSREWYRYHHLLRELLQAELRRKHPGEISLLHARAAAWYEANGMSEAAVEHAKAAGDADRMATLVLELMQPVWASGRVDTVLRWMEWLGDRPSVAHYAAIAAHGALVFALLGRASEAERWTAVAERRPSTGTLPDGSTVAATLAYLRAILGREGTAAMRTEARAAWDGLSPASPYRATMLHTEAVSYLLEGDLDRADAIFAHACDVATDFDALPLAALTLAERFLVAAERDDWPTADSLVTRAVELVDEQHLDGYWTSALVFATAARSAARRGDARAARQYVAQGARLRPLLTYALPAVSVQTLIELAHAYMALVDLAGAAAVLEQAASILQQRPDLGSLPKVVEGLQATVGQIAEAATGASSLTAAELRLLPLLPTHLSMPEIGDRLFISRHTVKTQVISVYRKLGVSSRGEAVARISELGMHG